jgi:hypothetical protein
LSRARICVGGSGRVKSGRVKSGRVRSGWVRSGWVGIGYVKGVLNKSKFINEQVGVDL